MNQSVTIDMLPCGQRILITSSKHHLNLYRIQLNTTLHKFSMAMAVLAATSLHCHLSLQSLYIQYIVLIFSFTHYNFPNKKYINNILLIVCMLCVGALRLFSFPPFSFVYHFILIHVLIRCFQEVIFSAVVDGHY